MDLSLSPTTVDQENELDDGYRSDSSRDWVKSNLAAGAEHRLEPQVIAWQPDDDAPEHFEATEDLYDPDADDCDEMWVATHCSAANSDGFSDDERLSCASCFHTVAYQCRRVRSGKHGTVYRAKHTVHCAVTDNACPPTSETTTSKRRRCGDGAPQDAQLPAVQRATGSHQYRNDDHLESSLLTCVSCGASIGFYEPSSQLYTFTDVLPSSG